MILPADFYQYKHDLLIFISGIFSLLLSYYFYSRLKYIFVEYSMTTEEKDKVKKLRKKLQNKSNRDIELENHAKKYECKFKRFWGF